MREPRWILAGIVLSSVALSASAPRVKERSTRFVVTYSADKSGEPLDGRLLLILSTDPKDEPRFQVSATDLKSQQVFGIDVDSWKAGQEAVFAGGVLGYPLESLSEIPAGSYRVQALLHRYETFHRFDGHVVKLPMDRGEGQQWNKAPGNLYSTPKNITLDPSRPQTIRIGLDQTIPAIEDPPTTKYVKHEKIVS